MSSLLATILILSLVGVLGALLLYVVAKHFHVEEDPRVEQIAALLPGANCGGCGQKGCRDFACRCVSSGSLDGIFCPVGGNAVMERIASIIGVSASASEPRLAVLRCNGTCAARPQRYDYDGARSCAVMAAVAVGSRGCSFGCLGCGDCEQVCPFDALHIDPATMLPVVAAAKCTACGKCTEACPRHLLELRPHGRRERRVWVACSSRDRGAVARKICANACIGCGKCVKACPFEAIDLADNLAYIDPLRCKACGKCLAACPTGAILATFTVPQQKQPANESCKL